MAIKIPEAAVPVELQALSFQQGEVMLEPVTLNNDKNSTLGHIVCGITGFTEEDLSSLYPPFLQKLLESCPTAGEGVHPWLFRVARYLHAFHSLEEICKILKEKTTECGRDLEPHEIPHAVQSSFHCQWVPPGAN
jgi:hypothetical protein